MHRFFVEQPIGGTGETVALSKEEGQHAARVLRLKPGESVCLLDGEALYAGEIAQVDEQVVTVRVGEMLPSPEAVVHITLWQGLPKGDKLEWIVQKATELGVWDILPVEMERSVARMDKGDKGQKKTERLRRVALEAAKQSGRAHVPYVGEMCGFSQGLTLLEKAAPAYDAVFVAWEEEKALRLSEAVRVAEKEATGRALSRVALVIGPEGGISEGECKRLAALGGRPVTLGKRILRTETAGLCALSVMMAALGEM